MRTRSHAYLPSPPPSSPPLLAHSRKRSVPSSPLKSSLRDGDGPADEAREGGHDAFSTPRKVKRVRFSDPGPLEDVGLGISSSGLTPSLRRTRLSAYDASARRRTLPASLEPSSSPLPPPQEIQFLPLRQVLDNRMRRRLRRNHLSETVNDIEQQRRDADKNRRELEHLRASGQNSDLKIKELMFELESQRQFGIAVSAEETAEHTALQEELQRLKFELLHHQEAPQRERLPLGASTEVATEVANDEDLWSSPTRTSSPFDFEHLDNSSSSPLAAAAGSPCGELLPPPPTHAHTGVQTNLPDLIAERHLANLGRLQTQLKKAQQESSDAKAALHTLHGDLATLGFAPATATHEEAIAAIHTAFRATRLDLERLLPGETPRGFENATLLPALTNHIRRQQASLADKDAALSSLRDEHATLRANFNGTLAQHADLENRQTVLLAQRADAAADAARNDALLNDLELAAGARAGLLRERDAAVARLEAEGGEQRVGLARLQAALESYRGEVAGLERVVGELEARNGSLAEVLEGTRAFLAAHVREAGGRVDGLVKGHEAACVAAEEFLRRGVAL